MLPRLGDPEIPLTVLVEALTSSISEEAIVSRRVRTQMIEGKRRLLELYLARSCIAVTCPEDQSCHRGSCVSEELDPQTLPATEPGGERTTPLPDEEPPCILVPSATISFGLVERGRSLSLPIKIRRERGPCHLWGVELAGAPAFSLNEAIDTPLRIPEGSSLAVELTYAPTEYGEHAGRLLIRSDDETRAEIRIGFSGASESTSTTRAPIGSSSSRTL